MVGKATTDAALQFARILRMASLNSRSAWPALLVVVTLCFRVSAAAEQGAATGLRATPDARDASFDSQGVPIHYTDEGRGEPVVLIHGFAMNGARWKDTAVIPSLLDGGFRVIIVDARGHGSSGKPHDPRQYGAEMARDIIRLLDHLRLEKAHVVGYSMGGLVTNKVRELAPERLRSATLGGAGWMEDGGPALADVTGTEIAEALERTGSFEWMLRAFTKKQQPPPTEEDLAKRNRRMLEGNDLQGLAAVLRGWNGFAVPERNLRDNRVPTLALIGAQDPLKVRVDALASVMRDLEVVVIPDADHGALAHPMFAQGLRSFLARHRE